ncbi:hypothetical protein T484DRAFT_1859754 [Baffinella frigidus]|nr:hypothetical protein T484DRAFT_1859754 [Cryptophyta sp. CCMP2293]
MTDAARLTETLVDAAPLTETPVDAAPLTETLVEYCDIPGEPADEACVLLQTELAVKLYGVPREDDDGSGAQSELLVKLRVPEATAVCPLSLDLIGGSDVDEFDGAGLDTALDPGCLPAVWHTRAQEYVARWNTTAQMEAIASDHDMALRDSLVQTTNIQLYMCVYIIQLDGHVETSLTVSVRYPSTQQDSSVYMGLASFCSSDRDDVV